jgi:hypothetical protein
MSRYRLEAKLRTGRVWPALERELARLGIDTYELAEGGKHPCVVIRICGTARRLPFSCTPKNEWAAEKQAVTQLRRLVAEMRR